MTELNSFVALMKVPSGCLLFVVCFQAAPDYAEELLLAGSVF